MCTPTPHIEFGRGVPAHHVAGAMQAPLAAFLLDRERRHELEWVMLASTPDTVRALAACMALQDEHRWRAEALRLANEWWWHRECLAREADAFGREVRGYLSTPSNYAAAAAHRRGARQSAQYSDAESAEQWQELRARSLATGPQGLDAG